MRYNFRSAFFVISLLCVITFPSCTSPKKVVYFNDLKDSSIAEIAKARNIFESPIQKNDQLSITVGGSNPQDLQMLTSGTVAANSQNTASGGSSPLSGYLVEADGTIQIPFVGRLKAEGLTRVQLQDTLTSLYKNYTKNPIVNVRFINYSFSILGEVGKPGKFNMTGERTTILEALSQAGDLTNFARRDNILVIREENGERTLNRINILSKNIFNSPYFYLKTNDMVYVEPIKSKFISRSGLPQYLSLIAIGLSLVLTIINIKK
jgi:polysaccharide biosynthesis/export protein